MKERSDEGMKGGMKREQTNVMGEKGAKNEGGNVMSEGRMRELQGCTGALGPYLFGAWR